MPGVDGRFARVDRRVVRNLP